MAFRIKQPGYPGGFAPPKAQYFTKGQFLTPKDPHFLKAMKDAVMIELREYDIYSDKYEFYVCNQNYDRIGQSRSRLDPYGFTPVVNNGSPLGSPISSSHTTAQSNASTYVTSTGQNYFSANPAYLTTTTYDNFVGVDEEKKPKEKKREKINLESVVMPEEKKEQIRAAMSQLENHKLIFKTWGFEEVMEKGTAVSLLFYGIPGTGKTLCAQAIADSLDLTLKVIQTAEVESSEPGQCERNIKGFFENAVKEKQLLLFDECDSLINDRNDVGMILGAQINALLTALESFTGVVVFTTNRLGKMDPAFERRVSAKIEFEFPNAEQRLAIWKRLIPKKAPFCEKVSFETLAKFPIPGGNIKNAVLSAARYAAYKKKEKIDEECFEVAVRKEMESMKGFEKAQKEQPHIPRLVGYQRGPQGIEKASEVSSMDFSSPPKE